MSGTDFMKLTVWELRRSLRLTSTRITLMALLVAGLLSIELGQRFWQSQQQEITDLTSRMTHRCGGSPIVMPMVARQATGPITPLCRLGSSRIRWQP